MGQNGEGAGRQHSALLGIDLLITDSHESSGEGNTSSKIVDEL